MSPDNENVRTEMTEIMAAIAVIDTRVGSDGILSGEFTDRDRALHVTEALGDVSEMLLSSHDDKEELLTAVRSLAAVAASWAARLAGEIYGNEDEDGDGTWEKVMPRQ